MANKIKCYVLSATSAQPVVPFKNWASQDY